MGEYYSSGLPPIRGGGISRTGASRGHYVASTPFSLPLRGDLESRPNSANSSSSGLRYSSYFRSRTSNSCYADYCAFKSPRNTGFCKLPSLRNNRRHTARVRHASYPSSSNYLSRSASLVRTSSEECIKCMLKLAHTKCEAHKYIRVGGGYRHSYWYLRTMIDEMEEKAAAELLLKQRLEAIQESGKSVRAIKTYIRTKSGRLIERIVFLTEEDYQEFKKGGGKAKNILGKYLSKDEVQNLDSWEKDEVKAIKTYVRTKSGRLIEKMVYVTKDDYEKIKKGGGNAKDILAKYVKPEDGETVEGWEEAEMKTIKTYIRTKSGRLVERTIMVSKEDYEALTKGGGDPSKILAKYAAEGDVIEGWKKTEPKPMKVVKTYIRTKSGRLVEKTILMTEEEFEEFQKAGGDVSFLKKFMNLKKGEVIEDWEKGSTVYEGSDDEELMKDAVAGQRIIGKDGDVYEVVIDPVTGKKYKKKITGGESDVDSGIGSLTKGRATGKSTAKGLYDDIEEETPEERKRRKDGLRVEGSDSDFSYKSNVSAGGTRHVTRRKKLAGGKYGDAESYHSSEDEAGKDRRKKRRQERKKASMGKRNQDSASEFSYKSDVSAGGTRHVKRRRRRKDGTYSDAESYHSSQDEEGKTRRRKRRTERKQKAAGKRNTGSDSDYSYRSVVSAGGTRRVKRKHKRKDGTYSDEESYHSSQDEEGAARRRRRRRERKHGDDSDNSYYSVVSAGGTRKVKRRKRNKDGTYGDSESYDSTSSDEDGNKKGRKKKKKRRQHGSDSEFSYYSEVSAGGTRHRKRKRRVRDEHGTVVGYGKEEHYSSDSVSSYETASDGKGGKIKIRKSKDPAKKGSRGGRGGPGDKRRGRGKGGADGESSTDFSDCTTDSETVARKVKNMTEKEKQIYLKERNKRKQERDNKRKEKYGERYEEIMEKHEKKKQEKKYQSMVNYGKGKGRFEDGEWDDREMGPGHPDWGKKGKKGRGKDGNEADSESEEGEYGPGGHRKKKGGKGGDADSEYEYVTDEHGNLVKKKKKKKGGDSDSEYEFEYDKYGNVVGKKKIKKKGKHDDDSDGDYFEVGEDGKVRLKAGKKKIDISKLTDDDLRKLGIDPNLSKQEITRLLKEKFGDEIMIVQDGRRIGMKHADDYASDANTEDLANDSDLDTSTLRGMRKINVVMRKGGQKLIDHMKKIIQDSRLRDEDTDTLEKKDLRTIDYMRHYQLVEDNKIDIYAKAFVCEDDRFRGFITDKSCRVGMEGIKSLERINKRQLDYVMKVLEVDENTKIDFRIFALVAALSERVTKMDKYCQQLLEVSNLTDIERKLDLYKYMFYCNTSSDRNPNYITDESLRIELMAGGLNWTQQEYIMDKLEPNKWGDISFLDYICYIPLFLSMHDNICDNPLDMSDQKYMEVRRTSAAQQRDMNPLGYPLKKDSAWLMKSKAKDILTGKVEISVETRRENMKILEKYDGLQNMIDTNKGHKKTDRI